MDHIETKVNTTLNRYLREARNKGFYCYYEVKYVKKGFTFNFSKIEINQDEGLPALQNSGLVWKLSDEDSRKKPCDGISAPPLPSFLIIKFNKSKKLYFINYTVIRHLKEEGKKSIDEKQCEYWSTKVIHI